MTNIRDIARMAGVSPSTVSRVLNGNSRVADDTRRRVEEVAKAFHYGQPAYFQGGAACSSGLLGYITHPNLGPGATELLQGVMEQAWAEELALITMQPAKDPAHIFQAVRTLQEMRVQGIILAHAATPPLPDDLLFSIYSSRTYLVELAFTLARARIDQVYLDYSSAIEMATEYLYSLHHRDIAVFSSPNQRLNHADVAATACRLHGMTLAYHQIVHTVPMLETALTQIFTLSPRPTAIIIQNDMMAWEALYLVERRHIRIPEDLTIIGLGDYYHGYIFPQLTSVDLHYREAGHETVKLMCRRIREGVPPSDIVPESIAMPPTLMVRGSAAAPAREYRERR